MMIFLLKLSVRVLAGAQGTGTASQAVRSGSERTCRWGNEQGALANL